MAIPQQSDLENFIDFLYEGLEGYVYVVAKEPGDSNSWDQVFFEWPEQRNIMVKAINQYSPSHEIYIAPAIFGSKNATKENFKATNVLWTEFDGNTPDSFDIPPSYLVRSSEPGHEHVYWKLDNPLLNLEAVEDYNRRICHKYGADNSAWDVNQVLRPPYTINHKRGSVPVTVINAVESLSFHLSVFDTLAPAPEKSVDYTLWNKLDLPKLNTVIYQNRFGPDFQAVFEKQREEVLDRSTTLTHAAFMCAEAGLNDKEIYVIIEHLATRWGKFEHHTPTSKARQLVGIIEHARIKHPHSNYSDFDQVFVYSPKALLETDIKVDWIIENMLMKSGVMQLVGPSGIGKTQFSMQVMFHLAVGKPFLHYEICGGPKKVAFFSLEMPDVEVKAFLQAQYPTLLEKFTEEEMELLNQNITILPFGEMLPMNTERGQDIFIKYLEDYKWDIIFVDSTGKSIMGNISSSEVVQAWINHNDKVRKRYGCALWYIHHLRKPAPGTTNYGDQSDVYGDQYIVASATSVYSMLFTKEPGVLRVRNPKNRHAKAEDDYLIRRIEGLDFEYEGLAPAKPAKAAKTMNPLEQITKAYLDKQDDPTQFKDFS